MGSAAEWAYDQPVVRTGRLSTPKVNIPTFQLNNTNEPKNRGKFTFSASPPPGVTLSYFAETCLLQ